MTGFDPIKLIFKITLLVMINTGTATAQQYSSGANHSNIIVDYSVIESLGPSPAFSQKTPDQPNSGNGRNNLYVGPNLKLPESFPRRPVSKTDVIVLQPPRNIKRSVPNLAKLRGEGVSKKSHGQSALRAPKKTEVRPPPPPHFSAPLKTIKALPTPNFSALLRRPAPPPPSIPPLEQEVKVPPISSTKALTRNIAPLRPKFGEPELKPETRIASIPPINQSRKAEKIKRIEFKAGSFELNSEATTALENLSKTLEKDSALTLQLHAYAGLMGGSAIRAKRLALSRALTARTYLIDRGVDITRISVKALGNRSTIGPNDRIDLILTKR